jgi:XTP/dITP diphosphohydrolase
MTILLATANPHKIEELNAIFTQEFAQTAEPIRLISLAMAQAEFHTPTIPDVEETGITFEENAYIKAQAYFTLWGIPVISDDSGLEIDALSGRPGVYSARYGGEQTSFAEKRGLIAQELLAHPQPHTARFRCVMCYHDGIRSVFAEGSIEGEITTERGAGGFGYDPIFQPETLTTTFGEMSAEEKHRISHRGCCAHALAELLTTLWRE